MGSHWLMLSAAYCDHISKAAFALNVLYIKITCYCYHSVDVITLCLAQSNHIKRLRLYIQYFKKNIRNVNPTLKHICYWIQQKEHLLAVHIKNTIYFIKNWNLGNVFTHFLDETLRNLKSNWMTSPQYQSVVQWCRTDRSRLKFFI